MCGFGGGSTGGGNYQRTPLSNRRDPVIRGGKQDRLRHEDTPHAPGQWAPQQPVRSIFDWEDPAAGTRQDQPSPDTTRTITTQNNAGRGRSFTRGSNVGRGGYRSMLG